MEQQDFLWYKAACSSTVYRTTNSVQTRRVSFVAQSFQWRLIARKLFACDLLQVKSICKVVADALVFMQCKIV